VLADDVLRVLESTRSAPMWVERIARDVEWAIVTRDGVGRDLDVTERRRIQRVLRQLRSQGLVRKVTEGGWQITHAGLARLGVAGDG